MTALAERPQPRQMRLALDGLSLVIGPAGSRDGYRAVLDVHQAREIALGLLAAADRAEQLAMPAMVELARIAGGDDA